MIFSHFSPYSPPGVISLKFHYRLEEENVSLSLQGEWVTIEFSCHRQTIHIFLNTLSLDVYDVSIKLSIDASPIEINDVKCVNL